MAAPRHRGPARTAPAAHRPRRTAGNRLDVSDVATGELLTAGEQDLDYFHGELHLSPGGDRRVRTATYF
ncbi:hypothetical protein Apa02nite_011840 [Actinoplanes palleronii]|uniref:Uncharacterized protein n=1 Tax=Actinoplanes palleronii TaxID=113570 RepID=A0ABQ4B323_9ACTN|nr:hypothetical protein Apa02nite_011840 [Actinoplanes palleronii]